MHGEQVVVVVVAVSVVTLQKPATHARTHTRTQAGCADCAASSAAQRWLILLSCHVSRMLPARKHLQRTLRNSFCYTQNWTAHTRTPTHAEHTHAAQNVCVWGLLIGKFLVFYALSAHSTVFINSKCFNYLNLNCSCLRLVNSFARIPSHFCFCVGDADVSAGVARV